MKNLLFLCLALASFPLWAQEYAYKVDLNAVNEDAIVVELAVPALNKKQLTFHMPAMVPGTYSVYDFGRFVYDFKVYDKDGNTIEWEHPDPNTWKILDGKAATKITYKIEDTWDTEKSNVIFEPAGTNIDEEVFVFNNHGIFGYFANFEKLPFRLEIDRPSHLFGGTAMNRVGGDADTDIFLTDNYNNLVDNPILFAKPDTAMIKVGKADVLIHTYSPTGRVKSKELVADIQPILEAQRAYLGGKLPVDKYAFLIFLVEEGDSYLSGSAGALEHSYSSFYCLFEGEASSISQMVRDVAAHEFFHIVTPLNIHSKEIHNFNFINPEMSKHLWLYEGATEYAAQHVQVKQGLVSLQQFLSNMTKKMQQADQFNQKLPFTELSKGALDEHKSQYPNVYLKGALINMALDMRLRSLSKGAYGIQDMMNDLSKKYGIEKPFKDKCLFFDIGKVSGYRKEMKNFFSSYVAGSEPLPITDYMAEMGIEYKEESEIIELSPFGFNPNLGITFNREKMLIELKEAGIDAFGKDVIGFQGNDLLYKWQGKLLTISSIQSVLTKQEMDAKEGDALEVVVLRKNDAGDYEEVTLKAALTKVPVKVKHALIPMVKATPEQLALRKAWLGDYFLES